MQCNLRTGDSTFSKSFKPKQNAWFSGFYLQHDIETWHRSPRHIKHHYFAISRVITQNVSARLRISQCGRLRCPCQKILDAVNNTHPKSSDERLPALPGCFLRDVFQHSRQHRRQQRDIVLVETVFGRSPSPEEAARRPVGRARSFRSYTRSGDR